MQLSELACPFNSADFSDASTRSSGLHLSTIIRELDRAAHGERYNAADAATRELYFAVGFAWEQMLEQVFLDVALKRRNGELIRPGEFHRDGIAMSPDAIDLTDWALEEYKATYLSSAHPIDGPKYWHWLVQIKCYCYAIGTRRARLRVWYIVGDWRGSGPQAKAWQFEFSDRDLEEAWQMVSNHARVKGWI